MGKQTLKTAEIKAQKLANRTSKTYYIYVYNSKCKEMTGHHIAIREALNGNHIVVEDALKNMYDKNDDFDFVKKIK